MAKGDWGEEWPIYVRDRCTCVYCGFQGASLLAWRQLVLDHLIPPKHGGSDRPENKVVACNYCNVRKNDHDPSGGQWQWPLSQEARLKLIEKAKQYITLQISKGYSDPDGELKDFQLMMKELKA